MSFFPFRTENDPSALALANNNNSTTTATDGVTKILRGEELDKKRQAGSLLGDVEAIDLKITIFRGDNLTPKDRSLFGLGKLTSSDPYCKVLLVQEFPVEDDSESSSPTGTGSAMNRSYRRMHQMAAASSRQFKSSLRHLKHHQNANRSVASTSEQHGPPENTTGSNNSRVRKQTLKLGRTKTIYRTLHPEWNDTIYGSLRGQHAIKHHTVDHPATLEFHVMDEDQLSSSDLMGIVKIRIPLAQDHYHTTTIDSTEWYDIPPSSAKNARGRLYIRLQTTIRRSHILVRGNTFELNSLNTEQQMDNNNHNSLNKLHKKGQVIQLGLSWDVVKRKKTPVQLPTPTPKKLVDRDIIVNGGGDDDAMMASKKGISDGSDDFVSGFPGEPPLEEILRQQKQRPQTHAVDESCVDLDASCVAISHDGHVIMPDTVYYGNLCNSNRSVLHSGDEQEGNLDGDDESITLHLDRIPNHILAMYIILTVATPNLTLADVQSTRVRVRDITPMDQKNMQSSCGPGKPMSNRQDQTLCIFTPSSHTDSGDATAMFLLRIARDPSGIPPPSDNNNNNKNQKIAVSKRWILTPIEDTHPTAHDFGTLIPHVKAYSRDLVPNIVVDPTERVAILHKGGNIRLKDYCRNNRLPTKVTFGLAWDVTDGQSIDLDASAICLDSNLNLIDMIWWKQLHSKDYNIIHHGDEREGDEVGDDEMIDLYLNNMSLMGDHVQYIGFVINSYSGQNLKDVNRASCHLFDPESNAEISAYALTNAKTLEGATALLVGCLFRAQYNHKAPTSPTTTTDGHGRSPLRTTSTPSHSYIAAENAAKEGEWCFSIISEASNGRTVKANVEGFRNYLKRNPPQPAPTLTSHNASRTSPGGRTTEEEIVIHAEMPPYVPLATEAAAAATPLPFLNDDPSIMATDSQATSASPTTHHRPLAHRNNPASSTTTFLSNNDVSSPRPSAIMPGRRHHPQHDNQQSWSTTSKLNQNNNSAAARPMYSQYQIPPSQASR